MAATKHNAYILFFCKIPYIITEVPGSSWMACICLVSRYIMAINIYVMIIKLNFNKLSCHNFFKLLVSIFVYQFSLCF